MMDVDTILKHMMHERIRHASMMVLSYSAGRSNGMSGSGMGDILLQVPLQNTTPYGDPGGAGCRPRERSLLQVIDRCSRFEFTLKKLYRDAKKLARANS